MGDHEHRRQGGGERISRVWSDKIRRIKVGLRRVTKYPESVMSGGDAIDQERGQTGAAQEIQTDLGDLTGLSNLNRESGNLNKAEGPEDPDRVRSSNQRAVASGDPLL